MVVLAIVVVANLFLVVNAHGSHKHHHATPSSEHHHDHHDHDHHDHHDHDHEHDHHHEEMNNEKHSQIHRHLLDTKQEDNDHHHHEEKKPGVSKLSIWIYSLGSSFGVSLLSFVGASLLFYGIRGHENTSTSNLQFILSCLAVGSLLGDCFLHLLPILYTNNSEHDEEHAHHSHGNSGVKHVHNAEASGHSFVILFGFILCLLIEVYLRIRQRREEKKEKANEIKSSAGHSHHHHSHIKAVGWINLIGDGIHNFMDGAGIAGAFQVSIPVGIANVLCICMHEIPQELSDYGILLSAGFSVKKALFFNFLSGVLSVVGCLFGLILTSDHGFEFLFINEKHLVALSAGSFMYIATSMIPIILDQLVESSETLTVSPESAIKSTAEEKNEKKLKDSQTSDFPTKLYYAIGSVTAGIILMHIIGVYEDSVTDMVTSFYR